MSDTDNYKLSFDYYLEYAVFERRDYLCPESVFESRDANEAFRELIAAPDGGLRTLKLLLKDPEGRILFSRELAKYGAGVQLWEALK